MEFARAEGAAFVNGSGINQPKGFLAAPIATTGDATRAVRHAAVLGSGDAGGLRRPSPSDKLIDLVHTLQGRPPPGRELGDELGDAGRSAQAQDRRRRVPVAAGPGRGPARPAARLSGGRGRGHARRRRGQPARSRSATSGRLSDRRAQRDARSCAIRSPTSRSSTSTRPSGSAGRCSTARRSSCSRSRRSLPEPSRAVCRPGRPRVLARCLRPPAARAAPSPDRIERRPP